MQPSALKNRASRCKPLRISSPRPAVLAKLVSAAKLFKARLEFSGIKSKWRVFAALQTNPPVSEQTAAFTASLWRDSKLFIARLMKGPAQTNNFNGKPMNHKTVHLNEHLYVK